MNLNHPAFKQMIPTNGDPVRLARLWKASLAKNKSPNIVVRTFNGVTGETVKYVLRKRRPALARPYLWVTPPGARQAAKGPYWEMVQ